MRSILRHRDIEWSDECHITSPSPNINFFEHPKEIEKLLKKCEMFFRDLPHGRPPDRGVEHSIVLEEGTSPIKIPPSRHPNKFKNEIDNSIQKILELGLIRPSSSTKILQEAHDFPLAGHLGIFKTYRKLRKRFFWKGMKEYFQKYVNGCKVCQQNKSKLTWPSILLQPFPILKQKWDSISMDFITGFPKYLGKYCLYLVVDRLKKFTHLFPITSSCSSAQVADIFFKEILPPLDDEGQLTLVPENILKTRERRLRSRTIKE